MKLLNRCGSIFGKLEPEMMERLKAVVANPTQETWDNAHGIILEPTGGLGGTTLWQAWLAVDPAAPRSKPLDGPWPRIPDQLTVVRAIRWAVNLPSSNRAQVR